MHLTGGTGGHFRPFRFGDIPVPNAFGPIADDFHAAFGVGCADGLAANDVAGVALAAIQELHRKNIELENEVEELKILVNKLLGEQ